MMKWLLSLNGAVTLSAIALVTEVWRGFLDAMFVFPTDIGDEGLMQLGALVATALFTAWTWSLIGAWQGNRGWLIAAFALNGLVWLAIPVSWLFFYCPADCPAEAGIFNLANTLNLLFGALAAVALGLQLRRKTRRAPGGGFRTSS